MKPILNKWQIWCRPFSRIYYRHDSMGWYVFEFGVIKIHKMPEQGASIGKPDNYRGFIIRFCYWLPVDRA